MNSYRCLINQRYSLKDFSIVPLRHKDRYDIMKWRNEQIYHLRQRKPLTKKDQDDYFETVVQSLFKQETPSQILFSFLHNDRCIGYGGLVHINWIDKNSEISFVMNTDLEKNHFQSHWVTFLGLLGKVAFQELNLHKIYTYAFDLRPHLYTAVESAGFVKEAVLKQHCRFNDKYIDVIIHSKWKQKENTFLRRATKADTALYFEWVNDESVRANAIQSKLISWESHVEWFKSKIETPEITKLFILELSNTPIGQIRFDLNEQKEWVISYSVSKRFRGQGHGKKIISMGLCELSEGSRVKAIVKPENTPSIKVFEGLGFIKDLGGASDGDYIVFKLTKK